MGSWGPGVLGSWGPRVLGSWGPGVLGSWVLGLPGGCLLRRFKEITEDHWRSLAILGDTRRDLRDFFHFVFFVALIDRLFRPKSPKLAPKKTKVNENDSQSRSRG